METKKYNFRSYRRADERDIISLLNNSFPETIEVKEWKWRVTPASESFIQVVESEKKIIGCVHSRPRPIIWGGDEEIKSADLFDFAIYRKYQAQGLARRLLANTTQFLNSRGFILGLGSAGSRLARNYYRRIFGMVGLKYNYAEFVKIINIKGIENACREFTEYIMKDSGLETESGRLSLVIYFASKYTPDFSLSFSQEGIQVKTEVDRPYDLKIKGDLTPLIAWLESGRQKKNLIKSALSGKIRFRFKCVSSIMIIRAFILFRRLHHLRRKREGY